MSRCWIEVVALAGRYAGEWAFRTEIKDFSQTNLVDLVMAGTRRHIPSLSEEAGLDSRYTIKVASIKGSQRVLLFVGAS
jgi:hypothetical protein